MFPLSGQEESELIHRDDPLRSIARSQLARMLAEAWWRGRRAAFETGPQSNGPELRRRCEDDIVGIQP